MPHKSPVTETTFEFGNVQIIDNIVIAVMNEGILFGTSYNTQLLSFCEEQLGSKPYGYISFRKNSYAVDPTVYLQTAQNTNIRAIAVVSEQDIQKYNVTIEKQFFNHPFEVFESLAQATNWMHNVLPNETTHQHRY
ncbi:MAG: hypothetical protein ACI86L_002005 [Dokdonia sp.]|jgi:hypothetical protein